MGRRARDAIRPLDPSAVVPLSSLPDIALGAGIAPFRMGAGESVCRRSSVREVVADVSLGDHPSKRPTRRCRNRSFGGRAAPTPTAWPCTGWGLPAATVARRTGALLPHRFTLACARRAGPSAVCSLLPCPRGRPRLSRLSILPCGAPTFLDRVPARRPCPAAVTRPTHQRVQCGAGWPGTQAEGLYPPGGDRRVWPPSGRLLG